MFDFVSYMRGLAESLKEIQHTEDAPRFHRITNLSLLEEAISNMRRIEGVQLIVEDVLEGDFIYNGNTLIDRPVYRFYLVKNAVRQDFDSKEQVKRECKLIAKKIIGRLFHDQYSDESYTTTHGLNKLDRSSFAYFSIGPILDLFYGVEVSFSLNEAAGIKYNAEDWIQ